MFPVFGFVYNEIEVCVLNVMFVCFLLCFLGLHWV